MSAAVLGAARRRTGAVASPVAWTRSAIIGLACLGLLFQALIDPSPTNLATALIAGLSSVLTALYVFRSRVMSVKPISSLIVFGLNFTLLLGPLIFQTLDWRAIAFNLDAPVTSVTMAAFASLLACLTHTIYRAFPLFGQASRALAGSVHTALFVFRAPTNGQLWLMGLIGLIATSTGNTFEARSAIEFGNIGGKFLQAFQVFVVAPAFIPIASYLFREGNVRRVHWIPLAFYFGLVVLISFSQNSRAAFAFFLLALFLSLAIAFWTGKLSLDRRTIIVALAALFVGLPALNFLSDLSTAMLVNRSARYEVSASTLVQETLETVGDKDALENYRTQNSIIDNRYNEIYIRNDFFQRLTVLKFLDLNVRHTRDVTDSQRDYARYKAGQRLLALLPTPVLSLFGLDVDKRNLLHSGGDVYRFLAARGSLGGYVTGSTLADGLVILGPLFWPFLMLMSLVSFIIHDAFCRRALGLGLFVSPVILFQLDRLFISGLNGDDLAVVIAGLLRTYPQNLLIYAGLFMITALVTGPFERNRGLQARPEVPRPPGLMR
jgi:hypothetical protein